MRKRKKRFLFAAISVALGLTISIIILEIVLRFLPVNEGLGSLPVNQTNPIFRFTLNRTSIWSRGWNFSLVNQVRTNNYGFVSNIDYDPNALGPLLAMIGDSYVEAAMVPYEKTAAGRLNGVIRVYSFAASGTPLSQYLAYAEYVRNTFHPRGVVIVVVGNDFDESLMKYKNAPGFHYFVEDNTELFLKRVDSEISMLRKLVRNSALAMYLLTNLKAGQMLVWASPPNRVAPFVGNTSADTEPKRVADSKRVTNAFLKMLPAMAGLNPSEIVLAVDGIRPHLYYQNSLEAARGSFFDVMRRYFIAAARAQGYEVIDMQNEFIDHYKKYGQKFEFPNDGHWNALGHEVLANAIRRTSVYARLSE